MEIRNFLHAIAMLVATAGTAVAFQSTKEVVTATFKEAGVPQWRVYVVEPGDRVSAAVCRELGPVITTVYGFNKSAAERACLVGIAQQSPERFPSVEALDRITVGERILLPDLSVGLPAIEAHMEARFAWRVAEAEGSEAANQPLVTEAWLVELGQRVTALESLTEEHGEHLDDHESRIADLERKLQELRDGRDAESVACPRGMVCVPDDQLVITVDPDRSAGV